jgi:hypothetical protein
LAQVLGRVTGLQLDSPRGTDVVHGIRVDSSWLEAGDTVELTLPRNLHCAECDGGGCDRCGRAGAVSLWGRDEPAAVLEVTLPRRTPAELQNEPVIVLRIPEAGGFPLADSGHPRGLLLLRVTASAESDPSVVRARKEPSARAHAATVSRDFARPLALALVLAVALILGIVYLLSRP